MTRPSRIDLDQTALLHNIRRVKEAAPGKKIIAMVKANFYGCGMSALLTVFEGQVDAFGVACLEEAQKIRKSGSSTTCILFQGVFTEDELPVLIHNNFEVVIHHQAQLDWLLEKPLLGKLKVWLKVDTGMHRLGFSTELIPAILSKLRACPWVQDEIGIMTHLASADEPENPTNEQQLLAFNSIKLDEEPVALSIANSAAILSFPQSHKDVVRPGIMLYGISPFAGQTAMDLNLRPVLSFTSVITAIKDYPANTAIGYGSSWITSKPSRIAIVPVGYGDGYPRHVKEGKIWLNGSLFPIVGRISMDMMTIDVTDCPAAKLGDAVELWGKNLEVEIVAKSAGTIPYELICQLTSRLRVVDN